MDMRLTETVTVKELLDRYPRTLQVFMDLNLKCVGCPAENFHTLQEVARHYNLDLDQFIERLIKLAMQDSNT